MVYILSPLVIKERQKSKLAFTYIKKESESGVDKDYVGAWTSINMIPLSTE